MFKRTQRVPGRLFSSVFKNSTSRHSQHFTVRAMRTETAHAAVIVSKKVAPIAVKRNTLKRKIRAALTRVLAHQKKTALVYAKKGVHKLSVKDMQGELTELFSKS